MVLALTVPISTARAASLGHDRAGRFWPSIPSVVTAPKPAAKSGASAGPSHKKSASGKRRHSPTRIVVVQKVVPKIVQKTVFVRVPVPVRPPDAATNPPATDPPSPAKRELTAQRDRLQEQIDAESAELDEEKARLDTQAKSLNQMFAQVQAIGATVDPKNAQQVNAYNAQAAAYEAAKDNYHDQALAYEKHVARVQEIRDEFSDVCEKLTAL